MTKSNPSLFVSHGAPSLELQDTPARHFLAQLGAELEQPKAILMISAHWGTRSPMLTGSEHPDVIYDFSGFPAELYSMTYPAPGSSWLVGQVQELLPEAGISKARGLDHGAWVPLRLMYPAADIPVVQLSLQPMLDARHHYDIGRKLANLRQQGVLIIGSGSLTHNLYEIGTRDPAAFKAAQEFADWVNGKLLAGDIDALLDYRHAAPHAAWNHPTPEHFLPLFVALGAAEGAPARELHRSMEMGILAMDAYSFA